MGYYACACGDTWASEVGVLSAGPANMILTGRVVRKGTNGAVSKLGLAFSAAGGLLIGLIGWLFAVIGHGLTEVRTDTTCRDALGCLHMQCPSACCCCSSQQQALR